MRIAVVGLGMAGLRAAMLLESAGHEVELFEARGRPGGRLHTSDEGQGVLYEAGGEWIDSDHFRILNLFTELGVQPEAKTGSWPARVIYKGKVTTEDLLWNDALEDDLRVEAAAKELCKNLQKVPWNNKAAQELEDRSLADFLKQHATTERGLWWVTAKYRSDEGADPEDISLLGWLVGYLHYLDRDGDCMSAYRAPGGFRAIAELMLKKIQAKPNFGKVLQKVRQDADGVTVEFQDDTSYRFDRIVLTMPPPAIERVIFEPALSVEKRCAIEACRMSPCIKICWQFDEPWWQAEGWSGHMMCDGPLQQTWDGSLGDAPILTAYIAGRQTKTWMELGDPVAAGLYELAKLSPKAAKSFVRGWVHNWVNDSYALGAFSHLAPGYVLNHMEHIAPREGLIHFAGEHTATWTGFIEGALESAERVFSEIEEAIVSQS